MNNNTYTKSSDVIKDNEDDSLKTDEDNEDKIVVKTGA